MERIELKAEPRNILGRKVKTLRRSDLVPAVVYGHGFDPLTIQVPLKDFERIYGEAGQSSVVYLNVDGQSYPTIIHDIVRDPLNDRFQHADFYKVKLDEKIHAKIPLNFVGEAPAVKELGGILVKNIHELEVEGFPQDLPHTIEVDVSGLAGFGSQSLVKNLPVSPKLGIKAKADEIVALVQEPISEEELKAQLETPAAAAPEEVEVIKKEKPEEKEGQEAPKAEAPTPDKR